MLRAHRRHAGIIKLIADEMAWAATATRSDCIEKLVRTAIYARHSDGTVHLAPAYGGRKVI